MEKKGLNSVITTAIIILVGLILIVLLWFFIRGFVNKTDQVGNLQDCLLIQTTPEKCIYSPSVGNSWYVTIRAQRGADAVNVSDISVVFFNETNEPPSLVLHWNTRDVGQRLPNPYASTSAGFILQNFKPEKFALAAVVNKNGYVCGLSTPIGCERYVYNGQGCPDIDRNGYSNGDDFDFYALCFDNMSLGQPCQIEQFDTVLNTTYIIPATPAEFDITRDTFINQDDWNAFGEAFLDGRIDAC